MTKTLHTAILAYIKKLKVTETAIMKALMKNEHPTIDRR